MMKLDMMKVVIGHAAAKQQDATDSRAFQLGLIAGMMPSYMGVLMASFIAKREKPAKPDPKATGGTGSTGTSPPVP